MDVFVTDRASAERYRYSAAYLEGIAPGEGRTVYAKDPERALAAGDESSRSVSNRPSRWHASSTHVRERLEGPITDPTIQRRTRTSPTKSPISAAAPAAVS